jgi:hypothetical protein
VTHLSSCLASVRRGVSEQVSDMRAILGDRTKYTPGVGLARMTRPTKVAMTRHNAERPQGPPELPNRKSPIYTGNHLIRAERRERAQLARASSRRPQQMDLNPHGVAARGT